jgi:hypothetical protein
VDGPLPELIPPETTTLALERRLNGCDPFHRGLVTDQESLQSLLQLPVPDF